MAFFAAWDFFATFLIILIDLLGYPVLGFDAVFDTVFLAFFLVALISISFKFIKKTYLWSLLRLIRLPIS